jgi:hypothetical protein
LATVYTIVVPIGYKLSAIALSIFTVNNYTHTLTTRCDRLATDSRNGLI